MKLTRLEINAVATAAYSGMWPPNAEFYRKFFGLPWKRAQELAVHTFTPVDIRRIKGALDRASLISGATKEGVTMKCIEDIKARAVKRVSDEDAAQLVKAGGFRYVPKSKWRSQKRNQAVTQEVK
jgi:hypothetical protein